MGFLIRILSFWICLNYLEFCIAFPTRQDELDAGQLAINWNSGPSEMFAEPLVSIEFPSQEQTQGWIRHQRAVNSRAKQQSIYVQSSRIIFNEDYDEPLVPVPYINTRQRAQRPSTSTNIQEVVTNKPKVKVPSRTESSKNPMDVLLPLPSTKRPSTKKPAVLKTTTTKRPAIITTSSTSIPVEAGSPECIELKEGDCDEIFEGSIYTPFRVQKPKDFNARSPQRRIQRMSSRHSNTGPAWSYV